MSKQTFLLLKGKKPIKHKGATFYIFRIMKICLETNICEFYVHSSNGTLAFQCSVSGLATFLAFLYDSYPDKDSSFFQ
jgi:hypothetical protein